MESKRKPWIDINGLRVPDFLKTILREGTMHVHDAMQLIGNTVNNIADVTQRNWQRIEEFASVLAKNEEERVENEKKRVESEKVREDMAEPVMNGLVELKEFEESIKDHIANYKPIVVNGNVTNAADEEDLHADQESGLISLADRSALFGKGYVILRKEKSFEEQVVHSNTIYEVRYDFNISEEHTMPSDCILYFVGGKIKGGKITGQRTGVVACRYRIFENVTFEGEWNIEKTIPEWFGACADGTTDCSRSLQESIDSRLSGIVEFGDGKYNIASTVNINNSIIITGQGDSSVLVSNGESVFDIDGNSERHFLIESVAFHSAGNVSGGAIRLGINGFCINTTIRDCSFVNLVYGISLHNETDNLHVAGCHFLWCDKAVYSADNNTNKSKITIENNHFQGGSNDGFDIRLESCNNVSVCNNLIQASARTNHTAIYIGYTNVSVIKNNYYEISSESEGLPNKCIVVTMSTDCNVEDIRTQGFMDSVLEINGPNVWDIYVKHLVYGSINGSSIDSAIKNNLGSNLKNKIYLIDATIGSFQESYISSLNGVDTGSFSYSYTSDLYVYKMDSAEIDLTNIFSVSNVIRFVVKIKNVELPVEEYIIDRDRDYTHYIGYEGFGKISYSADTKKLTVVSTSESVPMDLIYGISKMM